MIDLAMFKKALSLSTPPEERSLRKSCNTIPVARNGNFFGREDVLNALDEVLTPGPAKTGISSMAIYGLGGVGKTQIALEYAWSRKELFDAVLWIPAETQLAIEQNLSQTAVNVLKLPDAQQDATAQNVVLFMDWLKFIRK